MMEKRKPIVLFAMLALGLFVVGCAKRPETAMAPAPSVSDAMAPAAAALGTGARAPSVVPERAATGVAPERAAATRTLLPAEFLAARDLKEIHFDFDRYDIRPGDARILQENARWLKANPKHLVLIEGHCDERGTNEYNLALGERRAKATMTYLAAHGVPASRITLISYGEERPVCTGKTEACWAENRRANFLVKSQ